MSKSQSRKPAYIVIILICMHLVISFFATAPPSFNHAKAQYWSGLYTMPFFKQNWKLFGPEVPVNNYEIVLTTNNDESVQVVSLFKAEFKYSLFSKYGNTALGLQTWCELLEYELLNQSSNYYIQASDHLFKSLSMHLFGDAQNMIEALVMKNDQIIFAKRYD